MDEKQHGCRSSLIFFKVLRFYRLLCLYSILRTNWVQGYQQIYRRLMHNSSRIRKTIFAMVNTIKYLPRSVVFSLAIYLKLIKLAMEAINVPSPPIFVPIMSAEQFFVNPDKRMAVGTLLIIWLERVAVKVSCPSMMLIRK